MSNPLAVPGVPHAKQKAMEVKEIVDLTLDDDEPVTFFKRKVLESRGTASLPIDEDMLASASSSKSSNAITSAAGLRPPYNAKFGGSVYTPAMSTTMSKLSQAPDSTSSRPILELAKHPTMSDIFTHARATSTTPKQNTDPEGSRTACAISQAMSNSPAPKRKADSADFQAAQPVSSKDSQKLNPTSSSRIFESSKISATPEKGRQTSDTLRNAAVARHETGRDGAYGAHEAATLSLSPQMSSPISLQQNSESSRNSIIGPSTAVAQHHRSRGPALGSLSSNRRNGTPSHGEESTDKPMRDRVPLNQLNSTTKSQSPRILNPSTDNSLPAHAAKNSQHTRLLNQAASPNIGLDTSLNRKPQKPIKPKWKCEHCFEEKISCDGEIPCAFCMEFSALCNYPGRPKDTFPKSRVILATTKAVKDTNTMDQPKATEPVKESADERTNVQKSGSTLHRKLFSRPDSIAVTHESATGTQTELRGRSMPQDSSDSCLTTPNSAFSKLDETTRNTPTLGNEDTESKVTLPLEIEDIAAIVKTYESKMRAHRVYILKPLLRRARLDMQKSGPPQSEVPQYNPFTTLIGKSLPTFDDNKLEQTKGLRMVVHTKSFIEGIPSKWKGTTVPLQEYEVDAAALPKYRSIGRLPSTALVRNYHTLKYIPYFAENEYEDESQKKNIDELEERYKQDLPLLNSQRNCKEMREMWTPWVEDLLAELEISFTDICYYLLHFAYGSFSLKIDMSESALQAWKSGAHHQCPTCQHSNIVEDSIADAIKTLPKPDERKLALAGLLCHVFPSVSHINLWHFGPGSTEIKKITYDKRVKEEMEKNRVENVLCLVCYRHHCPTHGTFKELEPDKNLESAEVSIDDPELDNNQRQAVTLPFKSRDPAYHKCGVFCGDPDLPLSSLLGRQAGGTIGGVVRCHEVIDGGTWYTDDKDCGPNCFFSLEKRPEKPALIKDVRRDAISWLDLLEPRYVELFKSLVPLFSTNQRGPCMIGRFMPGVLCLNIFYYLVYETNQTVHNEALIAQEEALRIKAKNRPDLSRPDYSMTHRLDERPAFVPCSHTGPCQGNPDCSCFTNKIVCEWVCGCDMSCKRRYQGCNCAAGGKGVCSTDSCECVVTNRECDAHLCGPCGVAETLDPINRYDENARKGRCKNNCLQLGIPRRTLKGPSEVQGWGLFAGEDIAAKEYIGEYKGEVVSIPESDRRGAIYHNLGQEYLFVVNKDQEIDASIAGNKMRFMNDSQRPENINVEAKKMLCNGVQRIKLSAQKNIKAGDELLYNYNYPVQVVKKFWERGEGPTSRTGVAMVSSNRKGEAKRARSQGRFAKSSEAGPSGSKTTVEASPSWDRGVEYSQQKKGRKRKRAVATREERETSDLLDRFTSSEGPSRPAETALSSSFGAVIPESEEESDFEAGDEDDGTSSSEISDGEEGTDVEDGSVSGSQDEDLYGGKQKRHGVGRARGRGRDGRSGSARSAGKKYRKRAIQPGDRRVGGRAQRNAWMTRKANEANRLARGGRK